MAAQKKQLSLDANVIFDLAEGKAFAHEFREIFQSKGYALVLPPTAAHELHAIFTDGEHEARVNSSGWDKAWCCRLERIGSNCQRGAACRG